MGLYRHKTKKYEDSDHCKQVANDCSYRYAVKPSCEDEVEPHYVHHFNPSGKKQCYRHNGSCNCIDLKYVGETKGHKGDIVKIIPSDDGESVYVTNPNQVAQFEWSAKMGNTFGFNSGNSITVDCDGNSYVAGEFAGTFEFFNSGSTAGVTGLQLTSTTGVNGFVTKSDNDGNFQWSVKIVGTLPIDDFSVSCKGISVDCDGNSYVTGYFNQICDFFNFGSNVGVTGLQLTSTTQSGFIAKIDSHGKFLWSAKIESTASVSNNGICVDDHGNNYVIGSFIGICNFFNSGSTAAVAALQLISSDRDIFITKIDTDGVFQWSAKIGGDQRDEGYAICIDCHKNIYVTGVFRSICNFFNFGSGDIEPRLQLSTVSPNYPDAFIAKINSDGIFQWSAKFGGPNSDYGFGISVDGHGDSYVTGYFIDSCDFFNFGSTDGITGLHLIGNTSSGLNAVITKINTHGIFQWSVKVGGDTADIAGNGISTDRNGNSYVIGTFSPICDFYNFGSTAGITGMHLISNGTTDVFITKINTDGIFQWSSKLGSSGSDAGLGICIDCNGNSYLTGYFQSVCDFYNPGSTTGITGLQLTPLCDKNVFVAKLLNDDKQFKPKGKLQTNVKHGKKVNVCFRGNQIKDGFKCLKPGFDYYYDDDRCEYTTCCKCNPYVGTAITKTKMITKSKKNKCCKKC